MAPPMIKIATTRATTRVVTAKTRARADERLFIGRGGRSDGRRGSYIRSAAFHAVETSQSAARRLSAAAAGSSAAAMPREAATKAEAGPGEKAAPSISGWPPWAPTPG